MVLYCDFHQALVLHAKISYSLFFLGAESYLGRWVDKYAMSTVTEAYMYIANCMYTVIPEN